MKKTLIAVIFNLALWPVSQAKAYDQEAPAIRDQTDMQRQEATYQNSVAQTNRIVDSYERNR